MPRRVLICSNTSWYLYNFRLNLIDALCDEGYEVHSAAPHDRYTDRLREHVSAHHDLDFSSSSLNPLVEVRLLIRFHHLLRRVGAEALLSYTAKPNIYGNLAARALGIKVISNIAGLGSGFTGTSRGMELVLKTLYRLAFARSHCLFFQNPDDHALFIASGIARPAHAHVIPGSGVDTTHFRYQPLCRRPGQPFRFLFSARMLVSKGVLTFLEAARQIEEETPGEAEFVLCGSFDIDNRDAVPCSLLDTFAGFRAITFKGHVDDMRPMLEAAHCVVLPSFYREGVPRSLLEAMAVGRPLITTATPGCRETVNGQNGWLIASRSVAELKDAMRRAMSLPTAELEAMGLASRTYARQRFDERVVINAYLAQLRLLFAGGRVAYGSSDG